MLEAEVESKTVTLDGTPVYNGMFGVHKILETGGV